MQQSNRALIGRLMIVTSTLLMTSLATEASAEQADPALSLQVTYTADVQGAVAGVGTKAGRFLDNLDVVADLDLEKAVGWKGATLHAYGLNNSGGAPNDIAATLQGVDNIEVGRPHARLFELWAEQAFAGGDASVRVGLYNLNSEFYVDESAAMLIAPAFGIGSELSATGPNGPSIFPSTALGLRVNRGFAGGGYVRVAAVDAKSGVPGDAGGVDFGFDDGALLIAEVGVEGDGKLAVGAWRYGQRQADVRDLTGLGDPVRRVAGGAYLLGERRVFGGDHQRSATAFVRLGVSDGDTTPFKGGWQAGLTVTQLLQGRPQSSFSIGLSQGLLGSKFRANLRDGGVDAASAESALEVTYADHLTPRLTIQPDLQWVRDAGGDAATRDRWIAGLRLRFDLSPSRGS